MGLGLALGTTENAQVAGAKPPVVERYPWERQDGESFACYKRFVAYRNTPPGERSMRKLGVSGTVAFRWAKRWRWTQRAMAYDLWQLEVSDELANRERLGHRHAVVRFGSVSLAKASQTVERLDETKLSADEAIALAVNGAKLSAQALGINQGETVKDRAPVANVAVSLGFGSLGWAQPKQIDGEVTANEVKQNGVLVPCGEKVLAATPRASGHKRLVEKIIDCPSGKPK